MKKLLLIAALASLSSPALASKARLSALGSAEHLIDTQTVFVNPAHNALMADYATFEMGPTDPTVTATSAGFGAEGGFVRSSGDAKYMVYLGRKSSFTNIARTSFGYLVQHNPIELQYAVKGDMNWGVGLNYSSGNIKSTTPARKSETAGLRFGASTDLWEAYASVGIIGTATGQEAVAANSILDDPNATAKGTHSFQVGGEYKMENLVAFLKYQSEGIKMESPVNTGFNGVKVQADQVEAGAIDHQKIEGGQWFYGASYRMTTTKREGATAAAYNTKTTRSELPFLLGMEYDATSWATLRASVTQNVLLGTTKTDAGAVTTDDQEDSVGNNTTVGAGFGIRMNRWVLDGSWAASTSGDVNTTNFLTNAALTYTF